MQRTHRPHFKEWVAVLATVAAVVGGCSSGTTVQNLWKDPTYTGPIKKAVVLGIVPQSGSRRTLEDAMASALRVQGVDATASYTLFPGESVDKEKARAQLLAEGYDAVVVSKMTDKKEQTTYTGGSYWGGYHGGWGAYDTGTVMTTEYVYFENSVYDPTGEGKMLWSCMTETLNPNSGPKFASSLVGAVIPALAKDGIVPSPTAPKY
jgi:hypothetical protein